MPDEWDEADLYAWEEYQAKQARSASPEVPSPARPHTPKKITAPKKT